MLPGVNRVNRLQPKLLRRECVIYHPYRHTIAVFSQIDAVFNFLLIKFSLFHRQTPLVKGKIVLIKIAHGMYLLSPEILLGGGGAPADDIC